MGTVKDLEVLSIQDGQTAIIYSPKCNESFVFFLKDRNLNYNHVYFGDVDFVRQRCLMKGHKDDFLIACADNKLANVCIKSAYSTLNKGLAVQKAERDGREKLKLSFVNLENNFSLDLADVEEREDL